MALTKLLGPDRGGTIASASGNAMLGYLETASISGKGTRFVIREGGSSGGAKFGLYDGSYNLLEAENTGVTVNGVDDYVAHDGYDVDITAGDDYSVAQKCAGYNDLKQFNPTSGSGQGWYSSDSYSNDMADPVAIPQDKTFSATLELWGYPLPVITSVDTDDEIDSNQSGATLSGTNLLDDVDDPALWLCSTSDFATAPIKESQTVNSANDNGINFDVVPGSLSDGTVYAFIVTGRGQVNATGYAVTLNIVTGGNTATVAATGAASLWTSTTASENDSTVAATGAASLWLSEIDQQNNATVAASSGAALWLSGADLLNSAAVAATGAASLWVASTLQVNDCSVVYNSPAALWSIVASNTGTNDCTVIATSASAVWLSEAEQQNPADATATSAAALWLSEAEQQNPATVVASGAASLWVLQASQLNTATVAASSAAALWLSEIVQQNESTVVFNSAASQWQILISDAATNTCTVVALSGAANWTTEAEQQNPATVAATGAAALWYEIAFLENAVTISGLSAPSLWTIAGALNNACTIAAQAGASQWLATLTEVEVNLCRVAATGAASQWENEITQENSVEIIANAGASTWIIRLTNNGDLVIDGATGIYFDRDTRSITFDRDIRSLRF